MHAVSLFNALSNSLCTLRSYINSYASIGKHFTEEREIAEGLSDWISEWVLFSLYPLFIIPSTCPPKYYRVVPFRKYPPPSCMCVLSYAINMHGSYPSGWTYHTTQQRQLWPNTDFTICVSSSVVVFEVSCQFTPKRPNKQNGWNLPHVIVQARFLVESSPFIHANH